MPAELMKDSVTAMETTAISDKIWHDRLEDRQWTHLPRLDYFWKYSAQLGKWFVQCFTLGIGFKRTKLRIVKTSISTLKIAQERNGLSSI